MRFTKTLQITAMLFGPALLLVACRNAPLPPYAETVPQQLPSQGAAAGGATVQASASPTQTALEPAKNWDEYRLRAAQRLVQANPKQTFSGPVPIRLQSIPVLQIKLHADGSVRSIEVLRVPKFSPETVQLAMEAIKKAAPFGAVDHLPRPWQFTETFLYNDDLLFLPRSLAEAL